MNSLQPLPTTSPHIASQSEWLNARLQLLAREKEHTRRGDELAEERRRLPWLRVEKNYVFESDEGRVTLPELFAGRSQLIIYHFMFGPGWEEGCRSCSFGMDHIGGMLPHLSARDVSFAAVSRASLSEIEVFRRRMGWKFPWVSTAGNDFAADFHVSFTRDEMESGRVTYNHAMLPPGLLPVEDLPGINVFARDESGDVFHTYSAYARGCEVLLGTYGLLDLTPKGRDEAELAYSMAWVRHHDHYDGEYQVDRTAGYIPPRGSLFRPCCTEREQAAGTES